VDISESSPHKIDHFRYVDQWIPRIDSNSMVHNIALLLPPLFYSQYIGQPVSAGTPS